MLFHFPFLSFYVIIFVLYYFCCCVDNCNVDTYAKNTLSLRVLKSSPRTLTSSVYPVRTVQIIPEPIRDQLATADPNQSKLA